MEQMIIEYFNKSGIKKVLGIPKSSTPCFRPLGRGEYNINYSFVHPENGNKLVLRINTGSQMHLEKQIEYEFNALKLLEATGRTPKPYYVDGSKGIMPYGLLVMEFLEGSPLGYHRDLKKAAAIFADIHSCDIDNAGFLIKPEDPAAAILNECKEMAEVYLCSSEGSGRTKDRLKGFIEAVENKLAGRKPVGCIYSIVNTEVNSGNFLINEDIDKCYLIDWEKPLLSEAAQDLAHFIAPTTTYWKTDCILGEESIQSFIGEYCSCRGASSDYEYVKGRTEEYLSVTCLRGITWCAMAWVEYNRPGRLIMNEFTYKKICSYLDEAFMDMLEERFFYAKG